GGHEADHDAERTVRKLKWDYYLMCTAFGCIFGGTACATAVLNSVAGDRTGNMCNGVLYVSGMLSSLFCAVPICDRLGATRSIVLGGVLQAVYVFL
ncbi:unnamed protein product, partial [Amoebophrya sp. A25]